jgi:hypothetical protein
MALRKILFQELNKKIALAPLKSSSGCIELEKQKDAGWEL